MSTARFTCVWCGNSTEFTLTNWAYITDDVRRAVGLRNPTDENVCESCRINVMCFHTQILKREARRRRFIASYDVIMTSYKRMDKKR